VTTDVANLLRAARVVPVLRGLDVVAVERQAKRLYDAGFRTLEVTTTIPDWDALVAGLRDRWPDATVAVGTVVTAVDAESAIASGAAFLVNPYPSAPVRKVAGARHVPFVEGGFSPGEVAAAAAYGPAKLFPAHLGGPRYLRGLISVAPGSQIMPTGGISPSEVPAWLDGGAIAVRVGSALADAENLEEQARTLLGTVRQG